MTEKPKHPKPQRTIFNLSWETEADLDDAREQKHEEGTDEDDFEGHASGFNRPESS